jgi:hypothetical protein
VSPASLPPAVISCLTDEGGAVVDMDEQVLPRGSGAASASVARISFLVRSGDGSERSISLVRKTLQPLTTGRHAKGSEDPRHWAYWRREAEAYSSGLLPSGPGLRAPRCFGVVDNDVYLQEVSGPAPSVEDAAWHLGRWQVGYNSARTGPGWLKTSSVAASRSPAWTGDWSMPIRGPFGSGSAGPSGTRP